MTKEEAYEVWMAAVESGSDTAHIYRSWYNFNDWWRARSNKPAKEVKVSWGDPPEEPLFNKHAEFKWPGSSSQTISEEERSKGFTIIDPADVINSIITQTTGDGIPYEYISSTSTAPDSFFGRVASAGGAKDTEG